MKVCLIGNNLTSLILAYILSKKKINTEIYSTKTSTFNFKTRTLGITEHNLNYLANYFENIYQKIKITMIHGEKDESVPKSYSKKV